MIAFPKTASGADPLTGAPAPVDERQLRELGVKRGARPRAPEPLLASLASLAQARACTPAVSTLSQHTGMGVRLGVGSWPVPEDTRAC